MYRKLLGLPVDEILHIRDGWPVLSKGLTDMLTWDKGDVKDIFLRTYEYSFELWDQKIHVDMQKIGGSENWLGGDAVGQALEDKARPNADANTKEHQAKQLKGDYAPHVGHDPSRSVAVSEYEGLVALFEENQYSITSEVEVGLVTNENRERYVKDYIFWLTDKSIRPQYEAFARGFHTCFDKKALSVRLSTRFIC